MIGHTIGFGAGNADLYAVRVDAQGGVLWSKSYSGNDYGFAVADPLGDGGFLLVEASDSFDLYDIDDMLCSAH